MGTFEEQEGGLWDLELGEGWGEWPAMSLEKPMGTLSGDEFDFEPNSLPKGWASENHSHACLRTRLGLSSKPGCGRGRDPCAEVSFCLEGLRRCG